MQNNVVNSDSIKISPENLALAVGTVVKSRYNMWRGFRIRIMFVAKHTYHYNVWVEVKGYSSPLMLRIKERRGWKFSLAAEIEAIFRFFGKGKPINAGDRLKVIYDKANPYKCFLAEISDKEVQSIFGRKQRLGELRERIETLDEELGETKKPSIFERLRERVEILDKELDEQL